MSPIESAKLRSPPWDELREQRVLRSALTSRRARSGTQRLGRALAVAAALVVVVGLASRFSSAPVARLSAVLSGERAFGPNAMTLSEGSRVTVPKGGRVAVETERPDEVTISQASGRVRYDVSERSGRLFTVRAGGVTVSVLGTAFEVALEGGTPAVVAVRVERGRVKVNDGRREVELGPGEELRVEGAEQSADVAPSPAPHGSMERDGSSPSTERDGSSPSTEPQEAARPRASSVAAGPSAPGESETAPREAPEPAVSAEALLARADAARAGGRLAEAAQALEELLSRYPADPRAASARFTLGRVERARSNHAKAAALFHACAASGSLVEDCLAEEASAWQAAGRQAEARAAAERYLSRFPSGPHAARLQRMVE